MLVYGPHVDKAAKDNNGVKYLLVRQDQFDRTVDAKGKKTKGSKETVRAFLTKITKKNQNTKIWVGKRTKFAREFEKRCQAEGIQIYCTMSETRSVFAESTTRSLKNISYRYMKEYGYKYIHMWYQLVTTLKSGKNCSIDLIPKNINNSDLLSILYSKPLRKDEKPKLMMGDRVRNSKCDLILRQSY